MSIHKWKTPIILDFGSTTTLAGFAGKKECEVQFPSIVGRPRHLGKAGSSPDFVCGDKCDRRLYTVVYPIELGCIVKFDEWESLLAYTFEKLQVDPKEHPILLLEKPYDNFYYTLTEYPFEEKLQEMRQKICKIMFEKFQVPAFYIMSSAVAILYSYGLNTGMVVQMGETTTQATAVYEGLTIQRATRTARFGGKDLTEYMGTILRERGYDIGILSSEMPLLREVKMKFCYVTTQDYHTWSWELDGTEEKSFENPFNGGGTISLMNEQYRCVEAIFTPYMLGSAHNAKHNSTPGIHELIIGAQREVPEDLKEEMWKNIVFVGDYYQGLTARLLKELCVHTKKSSQDFNILFNPELRNAPWIGASAFVADEENQGFWITKEEYESTGPSIVHYKCVTNCDSPGNCKRRPSTLKLPLPPIPTEEAITTK